MANDKFLDVDDENTFYATIAVVLNNVFQKKKKDGTPYESVRESLHDIAANKKAWFPHIAKCVDDAWVTPLHIGWINIPSPDKCTITQIPLANYEPKDEPIEDVEYAVFNCEEPNGPNKYRFYGIFKRKETNEKHITKWKRISKTLDIEKWKATVNTEQ
jgi:hypothetical protein